MARINLRQFRIEQEATPGTAETLVDADLLFRIREGDTIEPEYEQFDTEEIQGSSSKRPILIGTKTFRSSVSYVLRGPGDLVTAPAIGDALEAAMLLQTKVEKMDIGAIAGGPIADGDTITGDVSGATATVFRQTVNGASLIMFTGRSGTFQAEACTASGGGTFTSSEAHQDYGYKYQPTDSNFGGGDSLHHVTCEMNQDGFFWRGRGCLGNLSMAFSVGKPVIVSQSFVGAMTAHGDAALIVNPTIPESAIVPGRFLNASLSLGGYTPTDIVDLTLSLENNPEARLDANDTAADGVVFADYERDVATIELEPAMVSAATKNWLQELEDGTTFAVSWSVGTAAGATWDFFADTAQYQAIGAGSRRDLATAPITLRLNGTDNDEFVIHQR